MRGPSFAETNAFVAVVEQKSFTKAAQQLGLSPPRISEMVRDLEERLDVRLIERTTRSVAPTAAGERLLERLRPVLEEYTAALESTNEFRKKPAGVLRITAPPPAADLFLASAVPRFLGQYPEVGLEISFDEALTDIVAARFDAGIRFGERLERDMIAIRLTDELPEVVVGSPAYFAQHGKPKAPADLLSHVRRTRHGARPMGADSADRNVFLLSQPSANASSAQGVGRFFTSGTPESVSLAARFTLPIRLPLRAIESTPQVCADRIHADSKRCYACEMWLLLKATARFSAQQFHTAWKSRKTRQPVITLYSYPELFGVADNNGYGLKVFAFLRLAGLAFTHEHIFDASAAPRGQLPYIVDDGEAIGDSEIIIAHLKRKYRLTIDAALTARQRDTDLLITRMLDDLYWVMSYSRWKDERYWPAFRDALKREHPRLADEGLLKAREFNFQRYYFAGIGRYAPDDAYARGLADLRVLADLVPAQHYVHGPTPTSVDAGVYGFIANIYFYDVDTPLKQFVTSKDNLVRHCRAIHDAVITSK